MAGTNNALNNSATVFQVDNLNLDGNTLSSTNVTGNIQLTPAAGGNVQATVSAGGSFQAIDSVAGETCLIEALQSNNSNSASDAFIRARTGGASGGSGYLGVNNSGGNSFSWGFAAATPTLLKESIGTPAGTLLRQMTSAGEQTLPLQPAFSLLLAGDLSNVTGDGTFYTVVFDSTSFDQGSDTNGSTTFTAPVAGRYFFTAGVFLSGLDASFTTALLQFVAAGTGREVVRNGGGSLRDAGGLLQVAGCQFMTLAASDTVTVQVYVAGGAKTVDINGNTSEGRIANYFQGWLVC